MRRPVLPFLALLLMAGPIACGALPRTGSASEARTSSPTGAEPIGSPTVMAWDGVNGTILMSRLWRWNNLWDSETYAFAGTRWTRMSQTQPLPTISLGQSVVIVYDSDRKRDVLAYGPYMDHSSQGTWEWDGKAWAQIITKHPLPWLGGISIPQLSGPTAAYSPDLHAVVVNGGGSTMIFDRTDWRSVSSAPPGCCAALAYSQARHVIVGIGSARDQFDFPGHSHYQTWTFDGKNWSPTPITRTASSAREMNPEPGNGMDQFSPSAAFDVKRDTWVLFGGMERCPDLTRNCFKADTWTGDATWIRRASNSAPVGRSGAGMVWDPRLNAIVLFGGFIGQCCVDVLSYLSDTWSWDGNEWHQLAGPAAK